MSEKPDWLKKAQERARENEEPLVQPAEAVVPGRVVNIDGDYLAYFASGGDEMKPEVAKQVAVDRIAAARELCGAEHSVLQLTSRDSTKGQRFLVSVTTPYQGQRQSGRKPKNWEVVREFLEGADVGLLGCRRVSWIDREADDGFARSAYESPAPADLVAHFTADKDMRMLPGIHLNWKDFTRTVVPAGAYDVVGEYDGKQYGHKWFWTQMLTGDTADHIQGIPKLGEVGAGKLLAGTTCNAEGWEVVARRYNDQWELGWELKFVEMATLLWLRKANYLHDFARILHKEARTILAPAIREQQKRVDAEQAKLDALNEDPPWQ